MNASRGSKEGTVTPPGAVIEHQHTAGTPGSSIAQQDMHAAAAEIQYQNGGSNPNGNISQLTHARDAKERPIYKLSVRLIDTYKYINKVYYEARAKREQAAGSTRGGLYNDGYDDQHYDYILQTDEVFFDRYILKQRIGKGSFGQVVCAYDQVSMKEVAIKIIKSRRPFMLQAQTEIELLQDILNKDPGDDHNIVRMTSKFVFRNHQCLVFEYLSYNLYELLKNTRFKGVSLNLIRKFSKQILKSLKFLASPEVDIIHCDLKPENILLRHPRRSAIKLIDFGSSCFSKRRTYTYIQSRFYRSPEILLGLKYDQKIDIWSLGCVLLEMHTGEPLFGGSDQVDQMCRIVDVLGMPSYEMISRSPDTNRNAFFERVEIPPGYSTPESVPLPSECDVKCVRMAPDGSHFFALKRPVREGAPPPRSLSQIVGVDTGGPYGRRRGETGHSREHYVEFVLFIEGLLRLDPVDRVDAVTAMNDAYISDSISSNEADKQQQQQQQMTTRGLAAAGAGADAINAVGSGNCDDVGEKRRGRDQVDWKPRSRSLSAPAGKQQQVGDAGKGPFTAQKSILGSSAAVAATFGADSDSKATSSDVAQAKGGDSSHAGSK